MLLKDENAAVHGTEAQSVRRPTPSCGCFLAADLHAARGHRWGGGIDVRVDVVGIDHVQGLPVTELSAEDYGLSPGDLCAPPVTCARPR